MTGAAWTDPWTNAAGSWEKSGENRYRSTHYVMIPEAGGILKISEEFWMLSKDEMEGRQEIWWVPGPDRCLFGGVRTSTTAFSQSPSTFPDARVPLTTGIGLPRALHGRVRYLPRRLLEVLRAAAAAL